MIPGEYVILSNGVYSDYTVYGLAVVLKEFDEEYITSSGLRSEKLLEHLVNAGYIKLIDGHEIWLAEGPDWGNPNTREIKWGVFR